VDNREPASEAVRLYNTVLLRPEVQKTREELQPMIDELLASGQVYDDDIKKDQERRKGSTFY
jgi:mannitol/fructose-specific phosphotransferase system IIA component (Ntr-type)